jgi:hypothetical protein
MSDKRKEILEAGRVAVDELIRVLRDPIITGGDSDLSADKMKTAAAAKRLAFEDALAMLDKIEQEEPDPNQAEIAKKAESIPVSFVESKAKGKER